ncbi:hypothetical protein [Salibaculum halophilum]|uniref:hypothetical protein n=1 Tax=Salibaculum halophilum TaxID=1914408 RepID=UPI000A0FCD40|nr:hypothetical protein [Salibaculum halophilum]
MSDYQLTPTVALAPDETVQASFTADRMTYWRDMAWMAAVAMLAGMGVLWAIGNPHVWTGAIGGLAAIALRGWYVMSDEMGVRWDLTDRRLLGPAGRDIALGEIETVRRLGSAVQVVTASGDKHLIKYQADAPAVMVRLQRAKGGPG